MPQVAERMLEMLQDWGLSYRNLRYMYHQRTPVQTNPPLAYHGAQPVEPTRVCYFKGAPAVLCLTAVLCL